MAEAQRPTPRTDAACFKAYREDGVPLSNYVVDAMVACTLEHELQEVRAELFDLSAHISLDNDGRVFDDQPLERDPLQNIAGYIGWLESRIDTQIPALKQVNVELERDRDALRERLGSAELLLDGAKHRARELESRLATLQAQWDDARDITGKGPDVLVARSIMRNVATLTDAAGRLAEAWRIVIKTPEASLDRTAEAIDQGDAAAEAIEGEG